MTRTGEPVAKLPDTMSGVVLTGFGGYDRLEYRDDLPVPRPRADELIVNVHVAGVNNTDINTRTAWYQPSVTSGTTSDHDLVDGDDEQVLGDWADGIEFPLIQGADVSGHVVATGAGVDPSRVGQRVVCDPYCHTTTRSGGVASVDFLGAHRDGGFAQFCAVPAVNAHPVPDVDIDDAALATLPCSAGTAMNMLLIADVRPGDRVIVTGASGGVGTFLVQIALHLGAEVAAIASAEKYPKLTRLGAHVVDRNGDNPAAAACAAFGDAPSVIADVVGGPAFGALLDALDRDGRYVTAGAIAGPIVDLDLRTLYFKNLRLHGSAAYRPATFPTLLDVLSRNGIRPIVDAEFPLERIVEAQRAFLTKQHVGSIVLRVPPVHLP